jgi:uncharacterized phage-associated protein
MHFRFDFVKTLQAAAGLLRHEPQRQMSVLRLLKLLYIADREAMKETGRPITCDRAVAMKHGPVLSRLYDIIKGEATESPEFGAHIERQGYQLHLTDDPGHAELNRFEIRKLLELSDRYRECGDWDLVEVTHTFPEWIKHAHGNSSEAIPLEDVLAAVGYSPERIEAIVRDAEQLGKIHRLFHES